MGKQLPTCARVMVFGVLSLLGSRTAGATPPSGSDGAAGPRVNLAFDTNILGAEEGARLELAIAEQLGPVLEQADLHVVPAPEAGDQTLSVRVIAFDEEQRNYEVDLRLGSEGGVTTLVTVRCDVCNERRLIATLVEETPGLVERHEKNLEKDGNAIVSEPQPSPEPPRIDEPTREVPKRLIGPLGGVGAAMISVGVAALVPGGYLLGRGLEETPGERKLTSRVDYVPVGASILAAGGVVAGVGIALMALDLDRARKGRERRFALQMTPTYVGIQIHQRF
jgi:hypothetical protein